MSLESPRKRTEAVPSSTQIGEHGPAFRASLEFAFSNVSFSRGVTAAESEFDTTEAGRRESQFHFTPEVSGIACSRFGMRRELEMARFPARKLPGGPPLRRFNLDFFTKETTFSSRWFANPENVMQNGRPFANRKDGRRESPNFGNWNSTRNES